MKLDIRSVELSKRDLYKGVRLPKILDTRLAEFLGIMVGDGHLGLYQRKDKEGRIKSLMSYIDIACNSSEKEYINYISLLFCSLFDIKFKQYVQISNCTSLRNYSKGVVEFLYKICGIPFNNKTGIVSIPEIIKKSNDKNKCAFLRGLADTDFSFGFKKKSKRGYNYPVIRGAFKSKNLIKDLEVLFQDLNFTYCTCYDEIKYDHRFVAPIIRHSIYLNGKENLKIWMNRIGFSNPKFQNKIEVWQREGVCPPKNKNGASGQI